MNGLEGTVSQLVKSAKRVVQQTFFPEGSIRTVLFGPCRGLRYRIFPDYGWSYLCGGWERHLVRVMARLISPGATVYDLGANYGMHALLFARLVGPYGRVYAFEPHPDVFCCLREQLDLNDFRTVVPICEAISENTGSAWFEETNQRSSGHLIDSADGRLRVQTTTLDDFVFARKAVPPEFIKIDIQGAESRALRGALNTLRQYHPTLVIELHNPAEDRAVGDILASLHYRAFRVHDGSRVQNMRSGWPDLNGIWGTVLAVPETSSDDVEQRVLHRQGRMQ
jgi:FkbM family methyltransferase